MELGLKESLMYVISLEIFDCQGKGRRGVSAGVQTPTDRMANGVLAVSFRLNLQKQKKTSANT